MDGIGIGINAYKVSQSQFKNLTIHGFGYAGIKIMNHIFYATFYNVRCKANNYGYYGLSNQTNGTVFENCQFS